MVTPLALFDVSGVFHPLFWVAIVSIILSSSIGYYSFSRGKKDFSIFFAIFVWTQSLWAVCDILLLVVADANAYYVIKSVVMTVQFSYAVAWITFVFSYTQSDWFFNRKVIFTASFFPALFSILYWLNPITHLMYTSVSLVESGPTMVYFPDRTAIFAVTYLVMVIYALAGLIWLLKYTVEGGTRLHRRQGIWVILSGAIILSGGTLSFLEFHPYPAVEFTSYIFVLGALPLFWAVYGHEFLSVVPIAREEVVDGMHEALLVVDTNDIIIDTNETYQDMFVPDAQNVVGEPLGTVFPGESTIYDVDDPRKPHTNEITYNGTGETEYLKVQQSPLIDKNNEFVGRVFLFEDVTAERIQKQKLEQQNERLDNFASVISHDLRNPLSVALGYTDIIAEDPTNEAAVATVKENLQRMDQMIDEVLELAREGADVEEPVPVSLIEMGETAWSYVDSGEATVEIVDDVTVRGDTERLQRAFENLLRNSIDHGGDNIHIEIGVEEDPGLIYYEDNGSGIPEDHRADLFEFGQTYSDDGTGFGLAIVQSIIEAHGWEINVVDPQMGSGARFEITGVTTEERN